MSHTVSSRAPRAMAFLFALVFALAAVDARAVDTPIAISTSSVDFGTITVGNTSPAVAVTLTNTDGVQSLGPLNIFGGAPPTAEFSASQNCQGVTLAPGATCSINYTFTPSAPGTFSDVSSFTISPTASQSDGEDFSVTLTGIGANTITASPLSHDFGSVNVGTTSPPLATIITNTGSTPFGPINIFGGAPPAAEFSASQNCQGVTLAPGATCSINYTFTPSAPGTFNDVSSFTVSPTASQSDGEDFSVSLTGLGANTITASPLNHDFGSVNVGTTSPTLATIIINTGSTPFGPINIFGGAPPTAEFSASQNCQGVTLAPGATCSINYTFTPSAPGTFNDVSSFTVSPTASQSDGEDFSVSLTGIGANTITASPLNHDFGSVNVGTTSPTLATIITNTGSTPFGPINIFGGAPPTAEFSASQNCQGATLAPGATCSINYTFTPSAPGTFNDVSSFTISPTASQSDGEDFSVTLAGCGAEPGHSCPAPTVTTLQCTPNPSTLRENVTCTATITTSGPGTPIGSVTFTADATPLGTVALDAGGQAALTTNSLTVGSHTIGASYNPGASDFLASAATAVIVQVLAPAIPTLSEWAMALFALLMAAAAVTTLTLRR